jgi:geranylgeranyl diphosphate synthase, type I
MAGHHYTFRPREAPSAPSNDVGYGDQVTPPATDPATDPPPGAPVGRAAPTITSIRVAVEETLARFLADERGLLARDHPGADALVAEIERVVGAGGKRLRPAFCVAGHLAAGGTLDDRIVRAGASIELLHTFALIHDDVMDGSPLRRGAPSTHMHMRESAPPHADPDRFGLGAAVLAGDLAAVLADHLLLASRFPVDRLVAAVRVLTRVRVRMGVGQFLDLRGDPGASAEEVRSIAKLKTGSYTVTGPLHVGVALAGGSAGISSALSRYGDPLGEAFQVRDDLLGLVGEEPGMPWGLDLVRGRPNALLAVVRFRCGPEDRRFLNTMVGAGAPSVAELDRIRDLLRSTGAIEETRRRIEILVGRAAQALDEAPYPEPAALLLRELADAVTGPTLP